MFLLPSIVKLGKGKYCSVSCRRKDYTKNVNNK